MGISTKNKISQKTGNTETETSAFPHMIHLDKFNYRYIFFNNTTHLLNKTRWKTINQSPCKNSFYELFLATIITTQITISIIYRLKQKMSFGLTKQHLCLMSWLLLIRMEHVQSLEMAASTFKTKDTITSGHSLYSPLLSTTGQISIRDGDLKYKKEEDIFRPFVPKDPELISRNVFTPSGQFRVFETVDTDLRVTQRHRNYSAGKKMLKSFNTSSILAHDVATNRNINKHDSIVHKNDINYLSDMKQRRHQLEHHLKATKRFEPTQKQTEKHSKNINKNVEKNKINTQHNLATDLKNLEDLLVKYAINLFEKGHYEPLPGLLFDLQNQHSNEVVVNKTRTVRQASSATDAEVRIDLPRTLQTGRLLFLTGLKKVLWPVFMGLQVLKSLLIAMFIPAIIGSFTKLLGKGITTGSAPLFIRPIEPPQELDFRDNTFAFEDDNKFPHTDEGMKGPYAYNNMPGTAQLHNDYVFDPLSANSQLSYNALGMNERQHQLMQDSYMNALQSIGSASFKNSGSLSSSSSGLLAPMAKKPPPAANVNTFQQFQNVPDSSLLLSNYDPFYSPLLSRLDSVFAQLKINSDKETCREKLICLMYANPAKYAPYSNLVSAQLSRELNELRKPTSDNPDILRFFKYMRAAKDGQDGVDCEKTFENCTEFKDFDNPAMVSTYHDINKLVQARKLTSK